MWGEFYKSCLLDRTYDTIIEVKLDSLFDRSGCDLNTNARLDELLRAKNTNIFQFSKDSGILYSTLANPRYRGTQLSVDTIEQICKVLGISMAEFFTVHVEAKLLNDCAQ